jgi:protein-S-isoprenylcysteine O-methyltransferase Ste14
MASKVDRAGERRLMQDHADVAVSPPLLFAGAILLGCLLSWLVPIGPSPGSANGRALAVGASLAVAGFALAALAVRAFHRAGTNVMPEGRGTMLVERGPYRLTRNPIYIGMIILYFGLAIMLTSMWMLLLLLPVLIVLQRAIVEREEVYLGARFGDTYRRYQARVPRWL